MKKLNKSENRCGMCIIDKIKKMSPEEYVCYCKSMGKRNTRPRRKKTNKCLNCSKAIYPSRKYCSIKCCNNHKWSSPSYKRKMKKYYARRRRRKIVTCEVCGFAFETRLSGVRKHCSRECANKGAVHIQAITEAAIELCKTPERI